MICLTFDTDHMSKSDIELFLNSFSFPGRATFFVHKRFPVLESTVHEICPHPFIDNLQYWKKNVEEIVKQLKFFPNGIRTHSCVFSHRIAVGLNRMGFKYVSQAQNMFQAGLRPYRHPWGIWEMPIYYMDNMDFTIPHNWPTINHTPFSHDVIKKSLADDSLYIFDFHPLHIVLNTRSLNDYKEANDKIVNNQISPFKLKHDWHGVGVFFKELCTAIEEASQRSYTCSEALEFFVVKKVF